MSLKDFTHQLLPAIEQELKVVVAETALQGENSLEEMLSYHLGWSGSGAGKKAQGKRIRPLLLLLSTLAAGGIWQLSLPAAAAIELVHNFSLIHDDIEDDSATRRGRLTLWKRHQMPLALNAGDSMFTLAYIALERLSPEIPHSTAVSAYQILSRTCLALTKGQHLDISFESQDQVTEEAYLAMIQGKTASLLASTAQLGAVLAGAETAVIEEFRQFGLNLGIAFQIQDDYLGIWGDIEKTGKSAASDLISRKKSLPILYGLDQKREFYKVWHEQEITADSAPVLAEVLAAEGAHDYTLARAEHYTNLAQSIFETLPENNQAVQALEELTQQLLERSA
jgi:geranylgeranyl diphosphate synthase type I